MASKNLIIGGYTNYGINQLKPWVLSAREVAGDNTDVVLIYGNTSQETLDWLTEQGVLLWPMDQLPYVPPHVMRFHSLYEFMRNKWMEYDFVVATDVKDVYFQNNPCDEVAIKCGYGTTDTYDLLVASEGLLYKDEPWGRENLLQAYGPYVYEHFKDNEIFNVGTFGGKSEYVKDMFFNIYTNALHRPISICDQAVFNVLINTQPFKENVYKTNNWAAELGTIMDPSKIEQFRPKLLVVEPFFEEGLLKDYTDKVFPIVHQYDRVPVLKKFVQEKYEQEDESQYFTYRV
jgi:hypothetical protein